MRAAAPALCALTVSHTHPRTHEPPPTRRWTDGRTGAAWAQPPPPAGAAPRDQSSHARETLHAPPCPAASGAALPCGRPALTAGKGGGQRAGAPRPPPAASSGVAAPPAPSGAAVPGSPAPLQLRWEMWAGNRGGDGSKAKIVLPRLPSSATGLQEGLMSYPSDGHDLGRGGSGQTLRCAMPAAALVTLRWVALSPTILALLSLNTAGFS